jgi:His/Glu/Gln/Arg/opine family amino acid ABC transporter permease subunit
MTPGLLLDPALWLAMLRGLEVTLILTVSSMALGFALALPVALARSECGPVLRAAAAAYFFVFRGVPLLMLLYLFYYGAAQVGLVRDTFLWDIVFRSALATAILVFALSNAAYLAEALRGGLATVTQGQREAGLAIGLTPAQVVARIALPIALRNSIRTIGNEAVFTVKALVIASVVAVRDVLGEAQKIGTNHSDNLTPLLAAAVFYLILVQLIEAATNAADRRLNPRETA